MSTLRTLLTSLAILLIAFGCSKGGSSPVTGDIPVETTLDSLPIIADDDISALGLFGAYNLIISPDTSDVELTPMRTSSLGESYIVDGLAYFEISPCTDCLRLDSLIWFGKDQVALEMSIKHPFKKGTVSEPPTAINRLDLDVFDLFILVHPSSVPPTSYSLASAYTDVLYNADGYTLELSDVISDNGALPYKVCYQDSHNNRFEMGTDYQPFDIILNLIGILRYELYLTMGYGWSATKQERLHPTYYIPEFNRKAAWKVKVTSPQWKESDTITKLPLVIDIYDWNHGATVSGSFPDPAHTDRLSAESDIDSVIVEIPGMTLATVITATTNDTEHDGWLNPITYFADIANENGLSEGAYIGLVKVMDSRVPGSPSSAGGETDTLVHTDDGATLEWYAMPEFATYQSFYARVVSDDADRYDGGVSWGGVGCAIVQDYVDDNIYVTGYFKQTVDFDPGVGEEWHTSNGGTDIFLSKFDMQWNLQWTKTWGGTASDAGLGLAFDAWNGRHIYVTGYFEGTADFDPNLGVDNHSSNGGRDVFLSRFDDNGNLLWAKTWGAGIWDEGHGVYSWGPTIWVTGYFQQIVDFDPSGGTYNRISHGDGDVFLTKFDNNGNHIWARTWGGSIWDEGHGVCRTGSNFYVTGYYQGSSVDFDPTGGSDTHTSHGYKDCFLSKIDENGNYVWARTWGGSIWDEGFGVMSDAYGVYVTGCFQGTVDFDPWIGTEQYTSNGNKDVFLTKFDHNGFHDWARAWGGSIWDEGHAVSLFSSDIYITGFFQNTVDFDPGVGEDWHSTNGEKNIFLSKFDRFGSFLWSRAWESTGDGMGNGACNGSIYVVGEFSGWLDFDPGSGEDWKQSTGSSVFMVKLSPEGNLESEPNDTCDDADELPGSADGSVRDGIDENDYWYYTSSYDGMHFFTLYNYSGQDINLYLYDETCEFLLDLSENEGGNDELVSFDVLPGITVKILVQNADDGYFDPKEYGIDVLF